MFPGQLFNRTTNYLLELERRHDNLRSPNISYERIYVCSNYSK